MTWSPKVFISDAVSPAEHLAFNQRNANEKEMYYSSLPQLVFTEGQEMTNYRNKHSTQTKVKVALEVLKGDATTEEITAQYGIHATEINTWKQSILDVIPQAFSTKIKQQNSGQQALIKELHKQIGQMQVKNDYLKQNQ